MNTQTYKFLILNRDNDILRNSFNELSMKIFGLSFENWYRKGYWKDSYIPYVLTDNGKVVSNISVNVIDCMLENENRRFIQLGTVMTEKSYRRKGLCSFIMNCILDEWIPKCDGIYLYVNDSVINFYPKFGFERHNEFQYGMDINQGTACAKKLDTDNLSHIKKLCSCIKNTNQFSKIILIDYESILMFYCTQFMKDCIYFVDGYDAVVIADFNKDTMLCYEVFGGYGYELRDIVTAVARQDTRHVLLGFTPKKKEGMKINALHQEDTNFFWHHSKKFIFENKNMMFPLLSHA